jgi:hypothetical protein
LGRVKIHIVGYIYIVGYYINTWVEYILKKKKQLCWNRYFCAIKCWVILFLIPFVEKDIFVKKKSVYFLKVVKTVIMCVPTGIVKLDLYCVCIPHLIVARILFVWFLVL